MSDRHQLSFTIGPMAEERLRTLAKANRRSLDAEIRSAVFNHLVASELNRSVADLVYSRLGTDPRPDSSTNPTTEAR